MEGQHLNFVTEEPQNNDDTHILYEALKCEGLKGGNLYHIGDGFYYAKNTEKREGLVYLKCKTRKCKGGAKLLDVGGYQVLHPTTKHSKGCIPDMLYQESLSLRKTILDRCRNENTRLRTIFEEECRRFPPEVAATLTLQQLRSAMKRARRHTSDRSFMDWDRSLVKDTKTSRSPRVIRTYSLQESYSAPKPSDSETIPAPGASTTNSSETDVPPQEDVEAPIMPDVPVSHSPIPVSEPQPVFPPPDNNSTEDNGPVSLSPPTVLAAGPLSPPPDNNSSEVNSPVIVKWNTYANNMSSVMPSLLEDEKFVDVTLACDGKYIKCHKVILGACSSYFEELLSVNPCQHPIILMRDFYYWEIRAIVDFMYCGTVNVTQHKLPRLLEVASILQIKGLTGTHYYSESNKDKNSSIIEVNDSVNTRTKGRKLRKRPVATSLSQSKKSEVPLKKIKIVTIKPIGKKLEPQLQDESSHHSNKLPSQQQATDPVVPQPCTSLQSSSNNADNIPPQPQSTDPVVPRPYTVCIKKEINRGSNDPPNNKCCINQNLKQDNSQLLTCPSSSASILKQEVMHESTEQDPLATASVLEDTI